jgi:hypothetical protein
MSENQQGENIVNQLVLDVKALVLLSENNERLASTLRDNILNSHDEDMGKFVSLITPQKKSEPQGGKILAATGELVLASFLIIVGLSLLAPSLMGLQSPHQLLTYFSQLVTGISSASLSNPLVPILDFIFSLLLLLGSFSLLRRASADLKQTGVS